MPDEPSPRENTLSRSDCQETRTVAHASRIIACPFCQTGVVPRISVFSISPLKFPQSTRYAGWNFREKNVSYAPGDSSKYFRQPSFSFSLFVFFFLQSRGQTKWSVASPRVRQNGKETERIEKTRIARNDNVRHTERTRAQTDAAGQSRFHKGLLCAAAHRFRQYHVRHEGERIKRISLLQNRHWNARKYSLRFGIKRIFVRQPRECVEHTNQSLASVTNARCITYANHTHTGVRISSEQSHLVAE